ncbi:MAG: 3D domain-containing protein [Christensenella sp.]|uniref:3D domain-containing protein n=1 Tax=Christensenella sp. TaxID=1935934 RepID=UPI002B21D5D7|nr:3D domain-containing protein [Christensenella sp.]MEA5002403.1 3D domain-containing protein [Christensenella sp.]
MTDEAERMTTGGGTFTITTYCPCEVCNSGYSGTATGTPVIPGRTVAVDPEMIPLETHLYIEGIGWRVAEDTGGAIKGNIIDLAVSGHGEFDKFSAQVWW